MKLLIAGSRGISDIDISAYIPDNVELIISGGAAGVDTLAEEYADRHRISKLIIRPDYRRYRRGAPIKRNEEMLRLCDKVLIFWDGKSSGTKHTMDYADKIGKEKILVVI